MKVSKHAKIIFKHRHQSAKKTKAAKNEHPKKIILDTRV
jgi:hypothetical protein